MVHWIIAMNDWKLVNNNGNEEFEDINTITATFGIPTAATTDNYELEFINVSKIMSF